MSLNYIHERLNSPSNRDKVDGKIFKKVINHKVFTDKQNLKDKLSELNIETLEEFKKHLYEDDAINEKSWFNDFITLAYKDFGKNKEIINHTNDKYKLISIFNPIIKRGVFILVQRVHKILSQNQVNSLIVASLPVVFEDIYIKAIKTLTLEYNIYLLEEKLSQSEHSINEEKFIKYTLTSEFLLSFIKEYPVLIRLIVEGVNEWINNLSYIFKSFVEDLNQIKSIIKVDNNFLIKAIEISGDKHDDGKAVTIITFTNNEKIVFKPHSVSNLQGFYNVIQWAFKKLNQQFDDSLKIVNKVKYGWVSFIKNEECSSIEDVKSYYENLGIIQAVFYFINGYDLHYENIIAYKSMPMLIDLECIFNPFNKEDKSSILKGTVLSSSLLPFGFRVDDRVVNIGASDDVQGESSFYKQAKYESGKISYEYFPIQRTSNIPRLGEKTYSIDNFYLDFRRKFSSCFNLILNNKSSFITIVNKELQDIECRILFRNTFVYGHLIQESYHPDYLRSFTDRELLFEHIRLNSPVSGFKKNIVKHELRYLLNGQIPKFSFSPNNRHLKSSFYEKKINNYLEQSGLSLSIEKIHNSNQDELKKQLYIMDRLIRSRMKNSKSEFKIQNLDTNNQNQVIVSLIDLISNELIINRKNELSNIYINSTSCIYGEMGYDFYNGYLGLAFFYGYTFKYTNDIKYKKFVQNLLTPERINQLNHIHEIGLFVGVSGFIYSCSHLYSIFKESQYLEFATLGVKRLEVLVDSNLNMDIIGGSAGAIIALIAFLEVDNNDNGKTLSLIGKLEEQIIDNSIKINNQVFWKSPNLGKKLGGFSHGTSGIISSLIKSYKLTNNPKTIEIIKGTLQFEKGLFNKAQGNWIDKRHDEEMFQYSWCNGSVGVGLSRLILLDNMTNLDSNLKVELKQDVKYALNSALTSGFGDNHSICHGDFGTLEFIYSSTQHGYLAKEQFSNMLEAVLFKLKEGEFNFGNSKENYFDISLMTGLSGIVYQLMRFDDSIFIPSLLSFDSIEGVPT